MNNTSYRGFVDMEFPGESANAFAMRVIQADLSDLWGGQLCSAVMFTARMSGPPLILHVKNVCALVGLEQMPDVDAHSVVTVMADTGFSRMLTLQEEPYCPVSQPSSAHQAEDAVTAPTTLGSSPFDAAIRLRARLGEELVLSSPKIPAGMASPSHVAHYTSRLT
jgi:hypothetical protein